MFRLVLPNKKYKKSWISYIKSYIENKEKIIPGDFAKNGENFDTMLLRLKNKREGINLQNNQVKSILYWAINDNDEIIGAIDLRCELNELYNYLGNIAYGVKHSERNKGNGTKLLKLGLKKCEKLGMNKILITCEENNVPSQKVIINNNGIFESKVNFNNTNILKYWIEL